MFQMIKEFVTGTCLCTHCHRSAMDRLVSWCSMYNLELNVLGKVEMIVDFSTDPGPPHQEGSTEVGLPHGVRSFKFYTALIVSTLSCITIWFAADMARDKAMLHCAIHATVKVMDCCLPGLQDLKTGSHIHGWPCSDQTLPFWQDTPQQQRVQVPMHKYPHDAPQTVSNVLVY